MKVEFIKIEIQNFKSIGDLVSFNYEDLKGLNFVYGKNLDTPNAKNGSGKSVLMVDSIVFALFGKTLKNTNNKYLPNRFVKEKLKPYVKVYFKVDGQLYSCETYGKVVSKTMHTVGMELLKLNDDYSVIEDLTQSSIQKTKQYIQNDVLGCSFNIFKSSIVISSADFMNFYEGMNKDQKRKYVENIFNLNCFGEMFSIIKTDSNELKKEITSSKNEVLKLLEKNKELTEKFNDFDSNLKEKREILKKKILSKINEIKNKEDEKKLIKFEDSNLFSEEKDKVKETIALNTEKLHKLEKLKMKNELSTEHINESINEMNSISDGLCRNCKKLINERYDYDNKKNEILKLEKDLKIVEKELANLNSIINDSNKLLNEINIKIKNNEEKKIKFMNAESDIKYLKNDIKNFKLAYDEVKEGTKNPFEELILESKSDIKSLKERLTIFNKNFKHLEILKDACSESGVKKIIMKDIVKLLNSLIQKYLNEIGCDFVVYFDETFDFKFLTSTGECEFSNFSAGERQRIQIATILAFRDIILNGKISSNIFIIDELLDANVDSICIENVMEILKKKSVESHQNIFIISHRSELADNESIWDNIIKITKENGQSTYEIK